MESHTEKEILSEEAETWFRQFLHAQTRQNETSDSFIFVQIQVAGVLLAFVVASLQFLPNDTSVVYIKLLIAGLVSLIFSISMGILSIYTKIIFWNHVGDVNHSIHKQYKKARRGDLSLKQVQSYILGATNSRSKESPPKFYWVLQTFTFLIGASLVTLSLISIALMPMVV